MCKFVRKLNSYLRRSNSVVFVLTLLLLMLALQSLLESVCELFGSEPMTGDIEAEGGLLKVFVMACIMAPLIETALMQKLFHHLFTTMAFFRKRQICIVVISGVLFGLIHNSAISYAVIGCFIGTVFMWGYILRIRRSPFWTIAVLHSLVNGCAIIYAML